MLGEGVRYGLNQGGGFEYDGSLLCGIWEMSVNSLLAALVRLAY